MNVFHDIVHVPQGPHPDPLWGPHLILDQILSQHFKFSSLLIIHVWLTVFCGSCVEPDLRSGPLLTVFCFGPFKGEWGSALWEVQTWSCVVPQRSSSSVHPGLLPTHDLRPGTGTRIRTSTSTLSSSRTHPQQRRRGEILRSVCFFLKNSDIWYGFC